MFVFYLPLKSVTSPHDTKVDFLSFQTVLLMFHHVVLFYFCPPPFKSSSSYSSQYDDPGSVLGDDCSSVSQLHFLFTISLSQKASKVIPSFSRLETSSDLNLRILHLKYFFLTGARGLSLDASMA